jgi:hypothetical protein
MCAQLMTSAPQHIETEHTRHPPLSEQAVQEPRSSAVVSEDNQFEVERVMDDHIVPVGRGRRKKMITQYWAKWKGYLEDDNRWVNRLAISGLYSRKDLSLKLSHARSREVTGSGRFHSLFKGKIKAASID